MAKQEPPDVRVVIANDHACVAGGASEVAVTEAAMLAAAGVKVVFLACIGPADSRLLHDGIEVILCGQDELKNKKGVKGALEGLWNATSSRCLRSIVDSDVPTILHVHSYSKALTCSIFYAARRRGWPILLSMHDYFSTCPNGGYYDFQRGRICHRKGLSVSCLATNCDRRRFSHKIYRSIKGFIQKLVGIPGILSGLVLLSEFSASVVRDEMADVRKFRLPNPVVMPERRPVAVAQNEAVVYVGQLSEEKGVLVVARATALLGLPIVFVGEGPLRHSIQKLNPRATITGWLPRDQVSQWLARARVLVFPSQWYEVQPLVPLEALSLGIPVIVSDLSAARDYILDDDNGFIVSGNDPLDWANAIRKMTDDAVATRLGAGAFGWFNRVWPPGSEHLGSLLEIYRQIIG